MATGGRRTTPRRIAIVGGGTSGPGAASPPRKRRAEAPWLGPRFRWPLDKTNARSYNGVHGIPQHTQPRSPRRITAGKGVHSCFASVRIRFECALYEYQTRPAIWAVQSWTGTVWSNLGHFSGESPTPAIRRHCVVPAAEGPPRSPTPLHNRHTGEGRYPDGGDFAWMCRSNSLCRLVPSATGGVGERLLQCRRGTIAVLPGLRCECVASLLIESEPPAMRSHKKQQFASIFGETPVRPGAPTRGRNSVPSLYPPFRWRSSSVRKGSTLPANSATESSTVTPLVRMASF